MLKFKDLMERINIAKTKMGDVIKDFQDSDAPQFKGKSSEKRRQMAIAAKLEADRGVKEEVEQIDELSPERLTKYKKQAEKQSGQMFKKMRKHFNKSARTGISGSTNSEKSAKETSLGSAAYHKGLKRIAGAAMASKKLAKEEVEELDELSTDTLKSYRKKARAQGNAIVDKMKMGGGDWSKDQKDTKTLRKRAAGAQASGKQLVKRGESLKTEDVEQTDEELKGSQHKLDANKNGKIDGKDFKILRNAKKARYQ